MIVLATEEFDKSISKLRNKTAKERLLKVIEKLECAQSLRDISNIKSIVNRQDLYRIRIGNHRLILSHKRNTIEILLLEYLKRDEKTYKSM